MIRAVTVDKLKKMRLGKMAEAFETQADDPSYQQMDFEDRFGMLVDTEWSARQSTKLKKLIQTANFRYPNACVKDIEYHEDRKLNKQQLLQFSTCRFIHEGHHIILEGASGNGKTYIACALGNAAAGTI